MVPGLSLDEAPPLRAVSVREPPRHHPRAGVIAVIVLGVLLAFAAAWIGVRSFLAHQELVAAVPDLQAVRLAVGAGDTSRAKVAAASLQKHAHAAAALTSDPVWQVAEGIPWVGANLSAVSTVASATDAIASQVVGPLVSVATVVDSRKLTVTDGRIDLAPFTSAQPVVVKAQRAFESARRAVASIDEGSVIGPIGSAVGTMRSMLGSVAPDVQAVGNAMRLLPGMLGQNGPRSFLIVAQNPAELRATGGLIGSVAQVTTDNGQLVLAAQAAGTSIGPWPEPVFDVPEATTGLYGPLVGRYLQDVNYTPDFPLVARTAAAMWERAHGTVVDGVITVDPVVLGALLRVTGPVTVPTGDVLTSENAVELLLSGVYARYPDNPALQDAFFASAATAVFNRLAVGGVDGAGVAKALAKAGSSGRVHIWSSHPSEQEVLATTSLAGGLPVSTPETAGLGVYFNDATGAKMDYYLATSVSAGAAVCRADGAVTSLLRVTLHSNAPKDAGTALPPYVTGAGTYGVPPGVIRTRIVFYGPQRGLLASVRSDGGDFPSVAGTDMGRPVAIVEVQLAPGESKSVDVEFLGIEQKAAGLTVAVTPTLPGEGSASDIETRRVVGSIAVPCASGIK